MKIVIDIPDSEYLLIKNSELTSFADFSSKECMMYAIRNGKPFEARPQGEWITKEYSIEYYCSLCGERLDQCCENFCCHCGADMRGDKDHA